MRISDWSSDVCSSDLVAQVLGAIAAAVAIYVIASGAPGYSLDTHGLAAHGFGENSPAGHAMGAGYLAQVLLTSFLLLIILGSPDIRAPAVFAPVAIGLAMHLIHLISITVTG